MSTHRLLVPTDLSEFGAAAIRYAAALRKPLSASITVLYADEPGYATSFPDLPVSPVARTDEQKQQIVDRVRNHVRANTQEPVEDVRVVHEFATHAILETADRVDASMIIMGTHGRRGWRRLMLGSVTENVLRQSSRPVFTVGPSAVPVQNPRLATVLCPVNFSLVAIDALREAGAIASSLDAELIILYVQEPEASIPLTSDLERQLAAWVDPQLRSHCHYRQIVVSGDAASRVLDIADQVHADLLVIGAQHTRFRDSTVIGSTSERIARFAEIPVLTIARQPEGERQKSKGESRSREEVVV